MASPYPIPPEQRKKTMTISLNPETPQRIKDVRIKVNINASFIAQQAYDIVLPFWEKVSEYLDDEDKDYPVLYPDIRDIPLGDYDVIPEVIIPKTFYGISDEDATPEDLERVIYVHIVPLPETEEVAA
jgi:hypothetical protein